MAVSVGFDNKMIFWDIETAVPIWSRAEKKTFDQIWSIALSMDGRQLVSGTCGGHILLWDVQSQQKTHTIHTDESLITAVTVSPDGKYIVSAHQSGRLLVSSVATGTVMYSLPRRGNHVVRCLSFSPNSTSLCTVCDANLVTIYNIDLNRHVSSMAGHGSYIFSCQWDLAGQKILTCAFDGTIKIWDAMKQQCSITKIVSSKPLWAAKWLENGLNGFVCAGSDASIRWYH